MNDTAKREVRKILADREDDLRTRYNQHLSACRTLSPARCFACEDFTGRLAEIVTLRGLPQFKSAPKIRKGAA